MVHNATRIANVYPNEQLSQSFDITTGSFTGTIQLKLYVVTGGVNSTYSFPIVVLQRPVTVLSVMSNILLAFKYLIAAIVVIVILILVYSYRKAHRPLPYNSERARKLIEIRNQIKRGHRLR